MSMTNGDRIRAMQDKELSVEIADLINHAMCVPQIYHGRVSVVEIAESLCKWLKEETNSV